MGKEDEADNVLGLIWDEKSEHRGTVGGVEEAVSFSRQDDSLRSSKQRNADHGFDFRSW